ncbi:DUF3450 domain-containing protein [Vibrio sp. SCSIO 43137]|uniref:DUF3450 domain-containing protein n=1 Tax=Vibrio sp. SCSIO 43137 TaxID=3021011 RepID=UPI0023072FF9|nr:DUF3450 domain-containing protein [Vibrio sp. SCSIO 43137]WCE28853.1 DUF3450 domain-containing protein [Vibrio sp. SCSIO 43137]
MNLFKHFLCITTLIALSGNVSASDVDSALAVKSTTNAASASSQKRIDKSAEKSLQIQAELEQLQQEVDNLRVYQDHLNGLVNSQQQEVTSLETQIEEIKSTRQGIVPLMYQMIASLKSNLAGDIPLKTEQRTARIAKLEAMMKRADVSDAEKYRRILEAYQIELDYGTKLGLYQGQISAQGKTLEADILHLGRISLVARSLNGLHYWSWDANNRQWNTLDTSLKGNLDKAYSIAAKQAAPALVTLPLSLIPEGK